MTPVPPIFCAIAILLAGCASDPAIQSVEVLDRGTGMTAAAMQDLIPFRETGIADILDTEAKQASIIYLGPVEWDRSGDYTYFLWLQVAPGVGGHRLDDIRARGAVTLKIDDKVVLLSAVDIPKLEDNPYRRIDPVGQSAYFRTDVPTLRQIAASQKLVLNLRASDLTLVDFLPLRETQDAMERFIRERGISQD